MAGRYTQVERHGTALRLLLAKNPAGWLEAFDVLDAAAGARCCWRSTPRRRTARTPPGCGTWTTAVLRGRPVFVAGERKLDLAVRLEADEVAFRMVEGIDEAVEPGAARPWK